ncbi:hypothetical protein SDC9_161359 [bioreactor metagenome]|uniref:Uncharacterized protein n=1 Tax=bioreactor metagenome TaxID=1076179 RepID=A0A645FPB7_9ZZZZ
MRTGCGRRPRPPPGPRRPPRRRPAPAPPVDPPAWRSSFHDGCHVRWSHARSPPAVPRDRPGALPQRPLRHGLPGRSGALAALARARLCQSPRGRRHPSRDPRADLPGSRHHVREVRPGPVDAPRPAARRLLRRAGHADRQPAGPARRRHPGGGPRRPGGRCHRAVRLLRGGPDGDGLDRPGARGGAARRARRGGQGPQARGGGQGQ